MKTSSQLLLAASHALRSYQYGNSAIELAREIADDIDNFLVASLNQESSAPVKQAAKPPQKKAKK